MMKAVGAVAMAVAALLVCCDADPHQEQDGRVGGHITGDRYDVNDFRQKQELDNVLRYLIQYDNQMGNRNSDGSTLLGRNFNTENLRGGHGSSSLLGRSQFGSTHFNGFGRSMGRDIEDKMQYARFVDPLGGGNFVRNLDSLGGGNFVRNLDTIGGGNFVKKNLDQIGGPNLVKRNLDSLGGGNLVRNLDAIGGGNFVREVDPLGGGNFV